MKGQRERRQRSKHRARVPTAIPSHGTPDTAPPLHHWGRFIAISMDKVKAHVTPDGAPNAYTVLYTDTGASFPPRNKKARHVCPSAPALHNSTVHRYFLALARTRASNTPLRIGVCAVWNGFSIVWRAAGKQQRGSEFTVGLTFT